MAAVDTYRLVTTLADDDTVLAVAGDQLSQISKADLATTLGGGTGSGAVTSVNGVDPVGGEVTLEAADIGAADTTALADEITRAEAAEALKAPLDSPDFTGNPTAPTQDSGDSSTRLATTAFVAAAVAAGGGYTVLQPSGDTTGATDAAAINAAIAALPSGDGGVVRLAPTADWNIECGQVVAATGVYIDGSGVWVNGRGAGVVFDFTDSSDISTRDLRGGGILGNPTIDGTHVTGDSIAVRFGDILGLQMYFQAQNFTAGTASKAFQGNNRSYWTEWLKGRIIVQNCTSLGGFTAANPTSPTTTTATGSFDRADLEVYIAQQSTANDGITFENGTYIIDGPGIKIFGNFNGAASAVTTAVLKCTGSAASGRPDATQFSRLDCPLTIGVECNTSGSDTDGPYSIYLAASGNTINSNGSLRFGADGKFFRASNATAANFNFHGPVTGEDTLAAIPQTPTNPLNAGQMTLVATTAATGFALQNGTPTILSWTAPDDGKMHRVDVVGYAHVTTAMTGGEVDVNYTPPDGTVTYYVALNSGDGTGNQLFSSSGGGVSFLVKANTTVSLAQFAALTAGAATVYAQMWAL